MQTINRLPEKQAEALAALIQANLDTVFPAISATVIHKGAVILNQAWGYLDPDSRQQPARVETLFDLASITKIFVVTALLSLIAEGHTALYLPVAAILPEFGANRPRPLQGAVDPHTKQPLALPPERQGQSVDPRNVTFWHLLTHTSGLGAWLPVYAQVGGAPPLRLSRAERDQRWDRARRYLFEVPFANLPGEEVCYSDLGLMLLGEAVARFHGGPLDQAVQERVLNPLGLKTLTYIPLEKGISQAQIAPTENDPDWRGRRCWGEVHDENACGVGGIAGHAGLFGTALEVGILGLAWLVYDRRLKIDRSLLQNARQEHAETGGMRRGLGWMLKAHEGASAGDQLSERTFGHTGFVGNTLFIDPTRDLVVVTLSNWAYLGRQTAGLYEFRRAFHDLIAAAIDGQPTA